jgi:hypothetical protein
MVSTFDGIVIVSGRVVREICVVVEVLGEVMSST